MTTKKRNRNGGLTKRCGCRRRNWSKCEHPYHLAYMWQGTHYRMSLKVSSKTEALEEAEGRRREIRAGKYGPKEGTAPRTLHDLLELYFTRHVDVHLSSSVNEGRRRAVIERTDVITPKGGLLAFGQWPIQDVNADTLERYREARLRDGGGRVAINRELDRLRACYNWSIHPAGYLTITPFRVGHRSTVRKFKEAARERRLENGEEAALLAACDPRLRAIVIAALETACRKGELLSLQWKQVRWDQNELHLEGGKTKSRKPRYVPISQRLKAVLEMRRLDPDGRQLPPDAYVFGTETGERIGSIWGWQTAVLKSHGIEPRYKKGTGDLTREAQEQYRRINLHFHDLRREAASRLLEGEVPEQYVQAVLGHANLTTTSRYLSTTRRGLHQVMARYEKRRTRKDGERRFAQRLHTDLERAEAHDAN